MSLSPLFKKSYYPLNTIEISSSALLNNYRFLSGLTDDVTVAPVLKSNAYGHGLTLVAKILDSVSAPFFCVDSLYEAYELLKNKIKTPILIMGYVNPDNLKVKKLPFSYAIYDDALVAGISRYQPQAGIHIFVDTGMHREGISVEDLPGFLGYIKSFGNLKVEGLMSHLGVGENPATPGTKKQIENFKKAEEIVRQYDFAPVWRQIAASGALLHNKDYKENLGNVARCGIALYGIDPEGKDLGHLQPALQLKTTLNQVKHVRKGEGVGYDFTFTAKKDMTIGILPLGYFDGVDRRLSNKGLVLVSNVACPIIGRVSMNLTTVDLSGVESPQVGDEVIVFANNPSSKNSIYNAALQCDIIPYELLVHLYSSTKRVIA